MQICFCHEPLTDLPVSNHRAILRIGEQTKIKIWAMAGSGPGILNLSGGQGHAAGSDWMGLVEPVVLRQLYAMRGSTIYLTKSNMLDNFVL
jgi:hypothetical protein